MRYFQIRMMHGNCATKGVMLLDAPGVRKLLPGEVFSVPCQSLTPPEQAIVDDVVARLGHLVEPCEPPTHPDDTRYVRPVKYGSAAEAALTDPVHNKDGDAATRSQQIDNSLQVSQTARQDAALEASMTGLSPEAAAREREAAVVSEAPAHLQQAFSDAEFNKRPVAGAGQAPVQPPKTVPPETVTPTPPLAASAPPPAAPPPPPAAPPPPADNADESADE